MKILDLQELNNYQSNSIVTIGFFDGVHIAHQEILKQISLLKKSNNYQSVVITFDDSVLKMFKMANQIIDLKTKLKIFEEYGIDYVLILKTEDNFMALSADDFIKSYLNKLNTKIIVGGTDLSFGKNRQGNIEYLKKYYNFDIVEIKDVYIDNNKVSSTYIRNLLLEGKVSEANKFLYQKFEIDSKVVKGFHIGKQLGYKTANLEINNSCYLLKQGVYFGVAIVDKKEYKTMINVGINPTVSLNKKLKVEAFIVDFDEDIYDKKIKLVFIKYHREEIKFENKDKLKEQLNKDFKSLLNQWKLVDFFLEICCLIV